MKLENESVLKILEYVGYCVQSSSAFIESSIETDLIEKKMNAIYSLSFRLMSNYSNSSRI